MKLAVMRSAGINIDGTGGDGSAAPGATGGQGAGSGGIGPLPALGTGTAPSGAPGASGGQGGAGGAGAGAGPVVAGGAGAGAPGAGAAAPAPSEISDISQDPDWNRGKTLIEQGNRQNAAGEAVGMKGLGEAQITEGQKLVTQAENRYKAQSGPVLKGQEEAQGAGRKDMLTNDGDESAARSTRNDIESKLEQLQELNEQLSTGPTMPIKELISRYGGIFGGDTRTATNAQEFEKLAYNEMYKELTASGLKGQVRNMEISGFMKQMPELGKTPQANRDIILNARGLIDKQNAYGDAYMKWRQSPEGRSALTEAPFQYQWNNQNPSQTFVNSRFHDFAAEHDRPKSIPPSAQLEQNSKNKAPRWRDPTTGKTWDWQGNPLR